MLFGVSLRWYTGNVLMLPIRALALRKWLVKFWTRDCLTGARLL